MDTGTSTADGTLTRWPGYAAAVWGFAFAVPSFLWATGHTAGEVVAGFP